MLCFLSPSFCPALWPEGRPDTQTVDRNAMDDAYESTSNHFFEKDEGA
jgi:hypothetical protein